ncbi:MULTISPECIES: zinc ABC transporter substrate-binding protein AztC [unclassified Micromonospora]|uniref:zinc ABC transporter substrate-binding protein AztC n=1 Tax=unclassified Micromonospora TaxID=2617518 RepID=UPI0022B682A9|nr:MULTISPECIES: zinc ABC transporter substrate-binding protein AztC [unclassified Micromonospora]MCZ7418692.1 zinc ABC transporter substrate-binding protein AztC [Verrucosispora sp. WMMA2121]WBB92394.1 zinc ABC transporter substrate-binding protein AztC [Verrucosispora sp. WMMC514]
MRARQLLAMLFVGALLTGGAACASRDDSRIVVTTNILGDVVNEIVGDEAEVSVLMKPNADPHSFAISAREAHTMQTADLVVYNGLGLEEGVLRHVESAKAEGVHTVEVGARIDSMEYQDGDAAGLPDPHFWTDPERVVTAVGLLADDIIEHVDGVDARAVRERAEAYAKRVGELDADLARRFAAIPPERRVLVTNHHVFGYLADRYDFTIIGAIIPSGTTLASPSSSDLASLVTAIRTHRVPAIFVDTSQPARLAEVLVSEADINVKVIALYSESLSEADGGAPSYLAMMRFNAEAIIGGLSG